MKKYINYPLKDIQKISHIILGYDESLNLTYLTGISVLEETKDLKIELDHYYPKEKYDLLKPIFNVKK